VSLNSPLASAPIIHPDVDTSDVVVAERGVFVVPCLVHGSHSVVELVKHVPEQQGEVTLLVKRGVDAVQLPLCWRVVILVVFIILIISWVLWVLWVSSSWCRCWSY